MPDENLTFNEIDSQEIYTQLIGGLMDSVGEPLYPGDERRIFGDALVAVFVALLNTVNDTARQKMLRWARGEVLDALGERYDVYRAEPAHASATFRFTVESARTENIIINQGTRITPDGQVYFATDKVAVLQAGQTYVDVEATCAEGGSAYNGYAIGSVSTLVDLIPYIATVSNTTVTAGGDDGEPYTEEGDEHFRERIRLAPSAQSVAGPESAYRFLAMSADPDIVDVLPTSPTPCVVDLYVLMRGGAVPDQDTLDKVEAACSADTVRPMTDQVTAKAPTQVSYDINIKYYCSIDNEAATIQAVEGEGGAIDQYNEWQCDALGRDINPDKLRALILSPNWADGLVGAERVEVTAPTFTALDGTKVAKFSGTLTVTHEVVTDT